MRTATVRDLRTAFPRLEAILREGEPIAITKRNRIVARLIPAAEAVARPDFRARFGGPVPAPGPLERSAVAMLIDDRGK